LLARLDAETLKNMPLAAMAFASSVLPVPGGPNNRIPFIAFRMPLKNYGIILGNKTASCSSPLALSSSAMSSKVILGHSLIYFYNCSTKFRSAPS
jgi:hypothetical protein